MAKLKFYRNTRPIDWVDADSLWVFDGAGNYHLVSADESYCLSSLEQSSLIGQFTEVPRPPGLHDDDIPIGK